MPSLKIPANGWKPRDYQMPAWAAWENGKLRSILIWHRRAGKDEIAMHMAAVAAHLRPANYWHCLPTYEQARKAIWEAVNVHSGKKRIDEAFPAEIRSRTDNSSMTIEFKSGAVWRIVGSDNPDSLVGAPPAGIVFSEWALSNPGAWGYLQPILLENGGWASFITTPRGRNHAHAMFNMARNNPQWFAQKLTVDDTHQVSHEQIEEVRREYISLYGIDAAEALIQQEYWCSFEAAILGAYWGKELVLAEQQGRICNVDEWEDVPVNTAWDLGVGDSMAIWWWQAVPGDRGKGKIRIVDFHEGHGYGIGHYANIVRKRASDRDYTRGTDFVPHDARVREQGSWGPDGRAKQRIEVMLECGLKPKVVKEHKVMDGISAVRQVLHRCSFDETRCALGLEALRQYRAEWDDEKKTFRDIPAHDWTSHASDAFRYLAMAYREVRESTSPEPGRMLTIGDQSTLPPGVKGATLEDLWALQRRPAKRI